MDLSDALTITALGMAVVFSGLLLTAGLITAFGRIQLVLDRIAGSERRGQAPIEPAASAVEATGGAVVTPEVLTVIVTVLEIEHRLRRVTPRRAASTESS